MAAESQRYAFIRRYKVPLNSRMSLLFVVVLVIVVAAVAVEDEVFVSIAIAIAGLTSLRLVILFSQPLSFPRSSRSFLLVRTHSCFLSRWIHHFQFLICACVVCVHRKIKRAPRAQT